MIDRRAWPGHVADRGRSSGEWSPLYILLITHHLHDSIRCSYSVGRTVRGSWGSFDTHIVVHIAHRTQSGHDTRQREHRQTRYRECTVRVIADTQIQCVCISDQGLHAKRRMVAQASSAEHISERVEALNTAGLR